MHCAENLMHSINWDGGGGGGGGGGGVRHCVDVSRLSLGVNSGIADIKIKGNYIDNVKYWIFRSSILYSYTMMLFLAITFNIKVNAYKFCGYS